MSRLRAGRSRVALNSHVAPTAAFVHNGGWKSPGARCQELLGQSVYEFMEGGEEMQRAIEEYLGAGSSELIGTTTRQRMRDVCGRLFEVDMVISVSQAGQEQMFSAILRTVKG